MASNAKPLREKTKAFVSKAREVLKKTEPNKAVRTAKGKKGLKEHYQHASKSSKNAHKSMF